MRQISYRGFSRKMKRSYPDPLIYADAAGMLLHINGKFTMEKLKSSLLSQISFLTALMVNFEV
jgi:hypothetical protein